MAHVSYVRLSSFCLSLVLVGGAVAIAGSADAAAAGCSRVASDFNGDGYADLAVSEPSRTIGSAAAAGAVRIDYGSATGIQAHVGTQYIDQGSAGIAGAPTAQDNFGHALAAGFFNGDCYADLAIGTPGEDDVTILYGSSGGLTTTGAVQFHGRAHADGFGWSLATGDFNHDGRDDLAGSAPFAGIGAGEITTMLGGSGGLSAPKTWISQGTAGVPGANEPGDLFGLALASGDFDGNGFADLAVGVPAEDDGSIIDAGSVTILRGGAGGIGTTGAQLWTQDSPGVPGIVETGDRFGYALAAGDVTGDGRADLVIGVPGEDDSTTGGNVIDGGAATLLLGSANGLTATGSQNLTEASAGQKIQRGDGLGSAVAVGDLTGDGRAEVALGVPGKDLLAGAVDVLIGSATGASSAKAQVWSQGSPGVPGAAEVGDEFGSSLLVGRFHGRARADLAVGAQLEDSGSVANCGAVTVLPAGSSTPLTSTGSQTFSESVSDGGAQSDDQWGLGLA